MNDELVRKALALWPLANAKVISTAQRENVVCRVASEVGEFALRFHRQGYHNHTALESELQWMAALAARGIKVPSPLTSHSGGFIEEIDGVHVDVLSWLPGKPMGSATTLLDVADRPKTMFLLGAALARLHTASDDWTPPPSFSRHRWDMDGLLGEAPFWGRFWDNPHLATDERDALVSARDLARGQLARYNLDYGLIHADPVRENVLLDGDEVCLIDFDDGGYGFRLFDLATVLLKCRLEHDFDELTSHLVAGYHSERPLDTSQLELMLALRAFTYVGWIVPRILEPWAPQRMQRFKQDALHYAMKFTHSASG